MRTIGLINTQDVFVGGTDALKGLGIYLEENEEPKAKRTRAKKVIEKVPEEPKAKRTRAKKVIEKVPDSMEK